jgi:hypothetical protein
VTAAGFLGRALILFAGHGIEVRRLLTDDGGSYCPSAFASTGSEQCLVRWRTRSYRSQANGKPEAFVATMQTGWAHKRPSGSRADRIG